MPNINQRVVSSLIEQLRPYQFRGKARLLNSLTQHSGERTAVVFGTQFHLDLEDYIQRSIFLGTFEPEETRIASNYLKKGMTLVDVGANVGYFTALGANLVGPGGRIAAFEPSPYAFERLSRMVRENQLTHVVAVNAGLSDTPGRLNIYLGKGSHNHTPTMVAHGNTTATPVSVQTLDLEMARLEIDRIDLLKIDVEGFEFKVLSGARRLLLEKRIKAVLCEFNDEWLERAGSSSSGLEELLIAAGFTEQFHEKRPLGFANRFFRLC